MGPGLRRWNFKLREQFWYKLLPYLSKLLPYLLVNPTVKIGLTKALELWYLTVISRQSRDFRTSHIWERNHVGTSFWGFSYLFQSSNGSFGISNSGGYSSSSSSSTEILQKNINIAVIPLINTLYWCGRTVERAQLEDQERDNVVHWKTKNYLQDQQL